MNIYFYKDDKPSHSSILSKLWLWLSAVTLYTRLECWKKYLSWTSQFYFMEYHSNVSNRVTITDYLFIFNYTANHRHITNSYHTYIAYKVGCLL